MKIFFDIGNTNIKVCFMIDHKNYYFSLSTNYEYTVDSFYNYLPNQIKNQEISKIVICSVVPNLTSLIEGVSKKYFNVQPFVIKSGIKTSLKINIDDPKSLGSDLICLGVFAKSYSDNTIIVNLGTATTIIHVKNSQFLGAIIMPGIQIAQKALVKSAAKIGFSEISFSNKQIARNTQEALSIGIINSHIFALEKHITNIDSTAKVIISGGNSKKIINHINADHQYIKEATIEGMKVLEKINEY